MTALPIRFVAHTALPYSSRQWRGDMLDRYARAEHTIFLCIRALFANGVPLPKEAYHDGAKTRLRALIATLESNDFGKHGSAALNNLAQLIDKSDGRTCLAHGVIKDVVGGVEIEWVRPLGPGTIRFERRSLSREQMNAELAALDKLQRDISSQLGKIRQLSTERAKIT